MPCLRHNPLRANEEAALPEVAPGVYRLGTHTVNGDVLDVPGRPRVLHTPGHTVGHCALLLEDRGVLFVGYSICTWNPLTGSRTPQVMPHAFNVDNRACVSSLEAIAGADAGVLLPGHGDPWYGSPAKAAERARAAAT